MPSYNHGALAHTHSDHCGIRFAGFRGGGAYRHPVHTYANTGSSHVRSYIHAPATNHLPGARGTLRDRRTQSQPATSNRHAPSPNLYPCPGDANQPAPHQHTCTGPEPT